MRALSDVRPLHLADLDFLGRRWPVFAWAVDGADGTILVDTGMIDSTPELDARWRPTIHPWPELGRVIAVVNTHLDFDHCGGNRRFRDVPLYVQRAEWEAVAEPEHVVEWVRFPGARYELLDGDCEIAPGVSVLLTPGHSPGHQAVVVETEEGPVVLAGDVSYSRRELAAGGSPPLERIHALRPRRVYLSHVEEPWEPA